MPKSTDATDATSYAPFVLLDEDGHRSLFLSDNHMGEKAEIFEEVEGFCGNGYDWGSVAQVVLDEQLDDLADDIEFSSEAGMFVALGPRPALERLGKAMLAVYRDDALLRDLLTRAELD